MATGIKDANLNLKKCLGIVEDVSHATSKPQDASALLSHLLRLLPCLESPHLSPKDLSMLRDYIWRYDLIHLIIEVLRNDYSSEVNGWRKLTNLAVTLASVVAGLAPKHPRKQELSPVEQVTEYYDIILPTSTDTVLILANSLLESLAASQATNSHPNLHECFRKIVDSLVWLCSGHKECFSRLLQSPYLLNILITDHELYSHVILEALKTLFATDTSSVGTIPQDMLTSILDELVYKLSGNDRKGGHLSLMVLAQLSVIIPGLVDTISDNYTGLLSLVRRCVHKDKELDVAERYLISKLETKAGGQGEKSEKHTAAVLIQALWRGYSSRRKMVKAQRGIRKFQQLYRKRKAEKLKKREDKEKKVMEASLKKSHIGSRQLVFHEKQLSLYQQLPASELQDFIRRQKNKAAISIQSAWRGYKSRSSVKELKSRKKIDRSAILIQRTFRRYSETKKLERQVREHESLPELSRPVRERLQQEIARYRDAHSHTGYRTHEQMSQLHHKAQDEYEKFIFSRSTQSIHGEEVQLLITKLNRNCELLLSAPSLKDSYDTSAAGIVESFCSSSPVVAKMARTAHREELKAITTPWWKRKPLDHDELSL